MPTPSNTDAIATATGIDWTTWVERIDALGGRDLAHAEIARRVQDLLPDAVDGGGWWAQGVTVAYEQHIGRRVPGQTSAGDFQAGVTRRVGVRWTSHWTPGWRSWHRCRPTTASHRSPDRG